MKESVVGRFHRQCQSYRDWLQHLTDRTQAARDLIAKEQEKP